MANIRLLCLITTGIGCYYGNCLDRWNKNAFKVKAQPAAGRQTPRSTGRQTPQPVGRQSTQPARPDLTTDNPSVLNPTDKSALLTRLGRFGLPERDVLIDYYDFEISYDNLNKIPNWVAEHLTFESVSNTEFSCYEQDALIEKEDRIHPFYQSTAEDYNSANAAFGKGFLVNGKSHQHTERSFRQSSKLSNVAPLSHCLAQNATWSDLEAFTRFLTKHYTDVYVFSGPIFAPNENTNYMEYQVIGESRVAVPTHFFKIIIARSKCDPKKFSIGCYVIPNDATVGNRQMNEYRVSLLELERKAGFKLFDEDFRPYCEDLMTADEFVRNKIKMMADIGLGL